MIVKKCCALLIFLFCNFFFSQKILNFDYRAKYKLTYKLSSTSNHVKEEYFYLFLNDKESFFISEKSFARDSIGFKEGAQIYDLNKLMKYRTYFDDRILYNSNNKDETSLLKYNSNYFSFTNYNAQLNWILTKNNLIINNIECNSATLEYFGRKWEAFYSKNNPFSYGPFKFHGLPGLIISIKDSDDIYKFDLIELTKKSTIYSIPKVDKFVNKEEYFKLIKDLHFSSKVFDMFTIQDDPSFKQKMRKAFEDNVKRIDNFPIEKDMRYIFE